MAGMSTSPPHLLLFLQRTTRILQKITYILVTNWPYCKRDTSKWNHEGVAPNPQGFFGMLGLPTDGKAWKQKTIALSDFEDAVGVVEASVGAASASLNDDGDMGKLMQITRPCKNRVPISTKI